MNWIGLILPLTVMTVICVGLPLASRLIRPKSPWPTGRRDLDPTHGPDHLITWTQCRPRRNGQFCAVRIPRPLIALRAKLILYGLLGIPGMIIFMAVLLLPMQLGLPTARLWFVWKPMLFIAPMTFLISIFFVPGYLMERAARAKEHRLARARLRRLEKVMARPGAAGRLPHRELEKTFLHSRRDSVDFPAMARSAPAGAPPCVVTYWVARELMCVPTGSPVSFEPIELTPRGRDEAEDFLALTAPANAKLLRQSLSLARPRMDLLTAKSKRRSLGRRLLVCFCVLFVYQCLVAIIFSQAQNPEPLVLGGMAILVIPIIMESVTELRRGPGRIGWWIAPGTIIVRPEGIREVQEVYRRADSRLWIDMTTRTAILQRGDALRGARIRPIDLPLLLLAWLSTAEPPPVGDRDLPV